MKISCFRSLWFIVLLDFFKESAESYRVVVGNQTVEFAKENDPSVLMAPSTGKLIKFLVDDGGHVNARDPYCEIEVMKMVTTLHVRVSKILGNL